MGGIVVSASIELVRKVFNELVTNNVLISIKERQNPLVSEYIINYGDKCPSINIDEDISMDRESSWYQVLTMGVGTKLSINRVGISLSYSDNLVRMVMRLMNGDRVKSSEEFLISCGEAKGSIYGKSIMDLFINLDLISRFLNTVKERRKLGNGNIDDLLKFLSNAKSRIEQDLRRIVSMYQWFEE
ncbi:hypothetical protein VMUT_0887 [Vulcanisaeta moutnovskia 768-28]|uniref:Uncharacterized protein n=1 Tax=Vulcanisaeta moutnovskia (strain 768-28) TaxID=985053 RepID=F0QWX9_VULM7|nr:hypothetical protein VMUT_0887 [Vulcanisaeta moutnovskia 768-28]